MFFMALIALGVYGDGPHAVLCAYAETKTEHANCRCKAEEVTPELKDHAPAA
jgi:hypothetical protein